jgi:uncharacterized membrane protein YhhN
VPPLHPPAALAIAVCALFGGTAIVGCETGRQRLVVIGKPAATLSLLLLLGIPPASPLGWLVGGGVLFSLAGDVALLGDGDRAFMIGTVGFLIAHVFYSAAFLGAGAWTRFPTPALAVVAASAALVVLLWPTLGAMRIPVAVYAVAITVMVVSALLTVNGPLPRAAWSAAVIGSVLFYLSDASLAWNRFRRPFAHAQVVTLSTYWLGQIGIVLCARWAG